MRTKHCALGGTPSGVWRTLSLVAAQACAALVLIAAIAACGGNGDGDGAAGETQTGEAPAASEYDLIEDGKLVVAQDNDRPWVWEEGGDFQGIDGEIIIEVAERLGLDLEIRTMQFAAELPAVETKRVDVATGGITDRAERRELFALSNVHPYYYFYDYTQVGECKYTHINDFKERTVGTVTGFALADLYRQVKGVKLKFYPTSDAAIQDLVNGRVDAISLGSGPSSYAAKTHPEWNIKVCPHDPSEFELIPELGEKFKVVYPFHKDNTALRDAVDEIVQELRDDGTIESILSKYISEEEIPLYFNP